MLIAFRGKVLDLDSEVSCTAILVGFARIMELGHALGSYAVCTIELALFELAVRAFYANTRFRLSRYIKFRNLLRGNVQVAKMMVDEIDAAAACCACFERLGADASATVQIQMRQSLSRSARVRGPAMKTLASNTYREIYSKIIQAEAVMDAL